MRHYVPYHGTWKSEISLAGDISVGLSVHWRLDKNRGPPPAYSFAAKHLGLRLVIEEIARPGPPAALKGIERRRRHGEMDVRVEVEPARTGSRHRHCPGFAIELPVVAAEGLNRRPASGA